MAEPPSLHRSKYLVRCKGRNKLHLFKDCSYLSSSHRGREVKKLCLTTVSLRHNPFQDYSWDGKVYAPSPSVKGTIQSKSQYKHLFILVSNTMNMQRQMEYSMGRKSQMFNACAFLQNLKNFSQLVRGETTAGAENLFFNLFQTHNSHLEEQ